MTQHLEPCPMCGKEVPYTTNLDDGEDVRWAEWSCPCGIQYYAESRIVDGHGNHDEAAELAELIGAWNTRAAATPEQFALAVHNGEAWVRQRTCRIDGVSGGGSCGSVTYRLSCGHVLVLAQGERFEFCSKCGAKVVD